ncbi:MAG: hypothetical protein MUF54_14365 [Polyangiaceae bacterium]|jgi:hypothetical protein|nr:hypothetical protein [Polyangiaceae bacterium]
MRGKTRGVNQPPREVVRSVRAHREQLARALQERGLDATLCVPPGPHNQPWLQEVGTLEVLLWHDRQLRSG